jgi:hypothetical protein
LKTYSKNSNYKYPIQIKEILKMSKFNLSDAAKAILTEGSKETFDANIKSKMSQRGGEKAPKGEVGKDKLSTSVVTGQGDVGEIGQSPEKKDDHLPDYTKGTPSATPPGATPPVGSEKDGVGATKPAGQPGETAGRGDLTHTAQADATNYETIRDRIAGKLAPQMMQANPGAHFQQYGEDMDALFSGESLSEEFKSKAATIFEAAVIAKATTVVEEMETELTEQFDAAVEEIKEELAQKVDDYLNYFVEEWTKENAVAIEKGLKAEIVEDFMSGLRDLFIEHYIDIPTEKVDIVEELTAKVEELDAALNEQIKASVDLQKELSEAKKVEAIHAVCEGLTQTQVEKLKSLAEGVEFTTEEEFIGKLNTLKESYFKADVKVADGSALDDTVEIVEEKKTTVKGGSDSLVEAVAKSISQSQKNW